MTSEIPHADGGLIGMTPVAAWTGDAARCQGFPGPGLPGVGAWQAVGPVPGGAVRPQGLIGVMFPPSLEAA
jgi:hypothetical protein